MILHQSVFSLNHNLPRQKTKLCKPQKKQSLEGVLQESKKETLEKDWFSTKFYFSIRMKQQKSTQKEGSCLTTLQPNETNFDSNVNCQSIKKTDFLGGNDLHCFLNPKNDTKNCSCQEKFDPKLPIKPFMQCSDQQITEISGCPKKTDEKIAEKENSEKGEKNNSSSTIRSILRKFLCCFLPSNQETISNENDKDNSDLTTKHSNKQHMKNVSFGQKKTLNKEKKDVSFSVQSEEIELTVTEDKFSGDEKQEFSSNNSLGQVVKKFLNLNLKGSNSKTNINTEQNSKSENNDDPNTTTFLQVPKKQSMKRNRKRKRKRHRSRKGRFSKRKDSTTILLEDTEEEMEFEENTNSSSNYHTRPSISEGSDDEESSLVLDPDIFDCDKQDFAHVERNDLLDEEYCDDDDELSTCSSLSSTTTSSNLETETEELKSKKVGSDLSSLITQVSPEGEENNLKQNKSQKNKTNNSEPQKQPLIEKKRINSPLKNQQIKQKQEWFFSKKRISQSQKIETKEPQTEKIGTNSEKWKYLLTFPRPAKFKNQKTLILDLDETLIHSSFKPVPHADFVIEVEVERKMHKIYVCKRPGLIPFLFQVMQLFEVVIFTASLATYADKVIDHLEKELKDFHQKLKENQKDEWMRSDPSRSRAFDGRLYRDSCSFIRGSYVKDLGRLGRELEQVIIVDNSPVCYSLQPQNAIPISSWFFDRKDRKLLELLPFLFQICREYSVYDALNAWKISTLSGENFSSRNTIFG